MKNGLDRTEWVVIATALKSRRREQETLLRDTTREFSPDARQAIKAQLRKVKQLQDKVNAIIARL